METRAAPFRRARWRIIREEEEEEEKREEKEEIQKAEQSCSGTTYQFIK